MVLVDRSLWETVTGTPSSWFDWLLGIFPTTYIKLSDLCASNLADPALPPFSTIAAAFLRDPSSISTVWNYIGNKITYASFAVGCSCNAGGTPTCSEYLTDGNAFPNTDTNATLTTQGVRFTANAAVYLNTVKIWTYASYPRSIKVSLWDQTTHTRVWTETFSVASFTDVQHAVTTPPLLVSGRQYILAKLEAAGHSFPATYAGAGTPSDARASIGAGCNNGGGDLEPTNTQTGVAYGISPVLCDTSSGPTAPVAPVQPTQPPLLPVPPPWSCSTVGDVCIRLQQLAEKVDWLIRIQPRPLGIYSVSESTVHAGLTGHGTLSVSGILGLKATVTTLPSYLGFRTGSPNSTYDIGRVELETAEGWYERVWLHETPQLVINLDPLTTTVGYTLADGVVLTLTELVRGP